MITESNITIYNKYLDKITRLDKWKKTQILNVHWEETKGINIIKSGMSNADSVKVFIPYLSIEDLVYIDPIQFNGKGFTIKPGDYIVKGLIEDEITSSSELEKQYKTAVKIKTVNNRNDSLIKDLWHFEVGCE
ncbi:hypothetical protein HMPREF9709_01191 [Helcococcus kunzii ATCC 51366]|uniref:Uncharacterized protein n=1 Tax=Helcococcus kunzii ATCC 51366 TaxID=883114 RepID=H3NPD0_9FIRM|nr:DUF6751 family protein [Helcococcus kunzii]EHR33443.1 hypothetical protein HMPREF9709_01191 [Helcococcus kunzii ATCC 51366]